MQKKHKLETVVILENIRSCHNVGAIFRTADGAGIDRIVLGGYTPAPPDRRIEKVSLGAETFIPWDSADDIEACVQKLKESGYAIVALEQSDRSVDIFDPIDLPAKRALILGNEVDGVSPEALALADDHLEIPMYGQKSSLNVSVAAGIAFYQITK